MGGEIEFLRPGEGVEENARNSVTEVLKRRVISQSARAKRLESLALEGECKSAVGGGEGRGRQCKSTGV